MAKLTLKIDLYELYPEAMFYYDWCKNSKNNKIKLKLLKKCAKEIAKVNKETLRKRVIESNK